MNEQFSLPGALKEFLCIDEVESGEFFAGELFRRKFGDSPPNFGTHMVLFYRDANLALHAASYLHLWTTGTVGLIGGGCTDGRTIRLMSETERLAIDEAGGLLLQTLRYAFDRHEDRLEAFFGHCGNDRALAVDLRAGFLRTADPNLLVRWNRDLSESTRARLFQQALALGPF
jgi:hypothetical protein